MLSSGTENLKDSAASTADARREHAQDATRDSLTPASNSAAHTPSGSRPFNRQRNHREIFFAVLKDPSLLTQLSLRQWDQLLRLARQAGLLSRLAVELRELKLSDHVPEQIRPHLVSALAISDRHERIVRWEFNRIQLALEDVEGPLVLLKGAAYLALGLPISKGRMYSDIDLMVPMDQLALVEEKLHKAGWRPGALDPRDARYFRTWLHELPPLKHRRRRSMLDVHHTILPRTDTLQVDSARLLSDSCSTREGRLKVLSPADMILHSAAHLFRNGDFSHAARDLLDLDGMIRHFSQDPSFWGALIERAKLHNLELPGFCGLRYAAKYYQTPLSEEVQQAMSRWEPGKFRLAIIDRLVDRAILPRTLDRSDSGRDWAINLLAHWPVPRWKAMFTGLFWTKRLPAWSKTQQAQAGHNLTNPERRVPDRPE